MVCNVNIVFGNLKSENSQDYSQKPQRNCMFMNSASVHVVHCTVGKEQRWTHNRRIKVENQKNLLECKKTEVSKHFLPSPYFPCIMFAFTIAGHWAAVSGLTPPSPAFRHSASQSVAAASWYRTGWHCSSCRSRTDKMSESLAFENGSEICSSEQGTWQAGRS